MLRVHCSGGIANAEALSMLMIFDGLAGFGTVRSRKKDLLRMGGDVDCFLAVDGRIHWSFYRQPLPCSWQFAVGF